MAMSAAKEGEEEAIADINVTPLVDVMLVLLIIFLITIPVVKQTQPIVLPKVVNQVTTPKPENIELTISEAGEIFQGSLQYDSIAKLKEYIRSRAVEVPQPEVHIRADRNTRYENVGRAIMAVQMSGMVKVAFISEPPPRT
jgi:biopolymer transport protein ExbD